MLTPYYINVSTTRTVTILLFSGFNWCMYLFSASCHTFCVVFLCPLACVCPWFWPLYFALTLWNSELSKTSMKKNNAYNLLINFYFRFHWAIGPGAYMYLHITYFSIQRLPICFLTSPRKYMSWVLIRSAWAWVLIRSAPPRRKVF